MRKLYCIPKLSEIEKFESIAESYDLGFEYDDFMLPTAFDTEKSVKDVIKMYKSLPRERCYDTLHGAFLDITVHSMDKMIYKASDFRIRQSMDVAMDLGVHAVIFHTNFIANFKSPSYMSNWVDTNEAYWTTLCKDYPKLEVYVENMFDDDPDLLLRLAQRMTKIKNFGVCLDFAHANLSRRTIKQWADALLEYTKHIHINDNMGDYDSHSVIGTGKIDWKELDMLIKLSKPLDKSVLVETNGYDNFIGSFNYLKENRIYPF